MKKFKKDKTKFQTHDRTKFSLAGQVLIFSLLATLLTAVLSYFALDYIANEKVNNERKTLAAELTEDMVATIKKYPAYEWLITYWYQNRDTLEVEYKLTDVTRNKARKFSERHPGLVIDYMTTEEVLALPEEDRKMYAEIVYTQYISIMNQMKNIYGPDYLSLLLMDPSYSRGTFLVSGASDTQKRGSDYHDAYILGVTVDATAEQSESMKEAAKGGQYLASSGDFVDTFGYVKDVMDGWHVILGVTFEVSRLINDIRAQVINSMILVIILQGVLALALYLMVYMYAVRPIERIQKNVWLYREEKNSKNVLEDLSEIRIRNELGALSSDISDMMVSIDEYVNEIQDITAEREKIAAELNVATKIQANMLPSKFPAFPDRKEFDLYATMTPAKEVGGDFYDFFFIDEKRLALVIADVSGKSVPAALFMVNSKTRIQNQSNLKKSPAEILSEVNDQLCVGNTSGFFVTVWMAIIDLETGKGKAVNAGHEHPVLRRANGSYEALIYRHSPAVGVVPGIPFAEHEFELHPGDRIYVYTDGVPEATSDKKELFGMDRMLDSLNSHGEDSLQELLPHVKEDLDAFVGNAPQFDDITMLGFEYYGPAGKAE